MRASLVSIVAVAEQFLTKEQLPCNIDPSSGYEPKNPAYDSDPCRQQRYVVLMGLTPEECQFGRSLVMATVLGGLIGWERRQADRPAGIRTMSLVCLGAATFTMGGQFAFRSSTMGWDAARVSAAVRICSFSVWFVRLCMAFPTLTFDLIFPVAASSLTTN